MKISDISDNLVLQDGIWYSKTKSDISYPDYGNEFCFQIEDNSFWFRHRNNCILELVKNFQPGGEIFDIGGGNGFVAAALDRKGFKTVLLDPGTCGVMNAAKRDLQVIICSTLEDAGFKKESILAIAIFDVLEHISDDFDFLKRIHSVVKANGMIYLSVPAYSFLWSEEDRISGHFRRYTQSSVSKLLKSVGFRVDYSTYYFFCLPVPVFFLKVLPYRLGFLKKENILKNITKGHQVQNKIIDVIVEKLLMKELRFIKTGKKIPFGGSILLAATKI